MEKKNKTKLTFGGGRLILFNLLDMISAWTLNIHTIPQPCVCCTYQNRVGEHKVKRQDKKKKITRLRRVF